FAVDASPQLRRLRTPRRRGRPRSGRPRVPFRRGYRGHRVPQAHAMGWLGSDGTRRADWIGAGIVGTGGSGRRHAAGAGERRGGWSIARVVGGWWAGRGSRSRVGRSLAGVVAWRNRDGWPAPSLRLSPRVGRGWGEVGALHVP